MADGGQVQMKSREEALKLHEALQAARAAYNADDVPSVLEEYAGRGGRHVAQRCAKSGMVLLDIDEYLEDPETGEKVLRSAIGLPPRSESEGDEGEEE